MIAKLGPKDFWTILSVGAAIFLAVILIQKQKSKFKPYRREYVRDTINTNPAKRPIRSVRWMFPGGFQCV